MLSKEEVVDLSLNQAITKSNAFTTCYYPAEAGGEQSATSRKDGGEARKHDQTIVIIRVVLLLLLVSSNFSLLASIISIIN
jgi:hypothetical protein